MSEHEYYEVEDIKDIRKIKNKIELFIKWVGYSNHQNTWEPL